MKSKFILITSIFFMAFSLLTPLTIQAKTVPKNKEFCISVRSENIRWIYKEINGKLYKRLYNYTLNEWVGEWMPA